MDSELERTEALLLSLSMIFLAQVIVPQKLAWRLQMDLSWHWMED